MPIARLHLLHSKPRTFFVVWQWSTCRALGHVMLAAQIAHLPPCFSKRSWKILGNIRYRLFLFASARRRLLSGWLPPIYLSIALVLVNNGRVGRLPCYVRNQCNILQAALCPSQECRTAVLR